jgi:hypothetical protein
MTEEIRIQQTTEEETGAVPASQQAPTGGARNGAGSATGIEITLERLMALTRQKSPIVGIPRLGDKPLALSRAILAGLLTGLGDCQVTLTNELEIRAEGRHYRLRSLDMRRGSEYFKSLKAWAARERKKKATRHLSREERHKAELLRKITIAERKARRLWVCRPYNPVLEFGHTAGDYEREQWAAWYAQKPVRRKFGQLAVAHGLTHGYVQAGISDPRKLYQALAGLTGQEVRKYGELRTTRRSEKPSEAEYLKRLYEYAGNAIQSKPHRSQEWRTPEHIRQERLDYCQRMRDWRNAQEAVNWLHAQLGSFETAWPILTAAPVMD